MLFSCFLLKGAHKFTPLLWTQAKWAITWRDEGLGLVVTTHMNKRRRNSFIRRKYGVECSGVEKWTWNVSHRNQCIEPSQSSKTIRNLFSDTVYSPKWSYFCLFLCRTEKKKEKEKHGKMENFSVEIIDFSSTRNFMHVQILYLRRAFFVHKWQKICERQEHKHYRRISFNLASI